MTRQANILSFDKVKASEASTRTARISRRESESHTSFSLPARHGLRDESRGQDASLSGASWTGARHTTQRVSHDKIAGNATSRRVAARIQDNQRNARASYITRESAVGLPARDLASRSGSGDRYAAALGESDRSYPSREHSSQTSHSARIPTGVTESQRDGTSRRSSRSFGERSISALPSAYHTRTARNEPIELKKSSRNSRVISPARRPLATPVSQESSEEENIRLSYAREKAQRAQNKTLAQEVRKRFRSAKAERAFAKTVGAHEGASSAQAASQGETSRAAMYEMRMGATHRKSARMQNENQRSDQRRFSGVSIASMPQVATRVLAVLVVTVFAVALLYPSCASYYQEVRQLQQLQAEYDAIESYNAQMQASIDYLNTDEGIEDYARSELGWIRADEKTATVDGVEVTSSDTTDDIRHLVSEESVSAPDTWYSGVLDMLLGYRG